MSLFDQYSEVWLVDFEFQAPAGCRPTVVCMVALELHTGRRLELWQDDLARLDCAPFDTGHDSLCVAYYASAEMNCFLSLGWPMPENVLDLYTEFRCHSNGRPTPSGWGLLGAMVYFGLPTIGASKKEDMRDLIMSGGTFSPPERRAVLDYCGTDVDALALLCPAMQDILQPQALLRGRYMKAVACMEYNGVPLDQNTLDRFRASWTDIQDGLIQRIAGEYGIYDGRTFNRSNFARWLNTNDIPWPHLPTGQLALDDATFKSMANIYPRIAPIRELRCALSQMRLNELAVGPDNRNRQLLSAFRSKSGRNQPSNTKFIFGPAVWLRSLIQPQPGHALAYIDWSQQEFGIAAALSGDTTMQEAYSSGDPYLGFAKAAGAVPHDATKESHPKERAMFKATVLGVQYSMGAESLAARLNVPVAEAKHLLELHRKSFSTFWTWSDAAVNYAMLTGRIHTVFGWYLYVTSNTNTRTLRNFPMQANGAEMMRLAACYGTERGIRVCCPVHDAFLIEAPLNEIDQAVSDMQDAMTQASRDVLGGFELASDADIYRYPERYTDKRGEQMWNTVMDLLSNVPPQQQ